MDDPHGRGRQLHEHAETKIPVYDRGLCATLFPQTLSRYLSADVSARLIGRGPQAQHVIDQEISTIDAVVQSLRNLRILKSKARNADAPISRLPPELLAEIFLNCAESTILGQSNPIAHQLDIRLVIGQVCTTWRSIAWDCPMFWTSVYFCVPNPNKFQRSQLLVQWLRRTRDLPISIKIDFEDEDVWTRLGIRAPLDILDILMTFRNQWEYLDIVLPESWLHHLNAFDSSRYVQLKQLKIRSIHSAWQEDDDDDVRVEGFLNPPLLSAVSFWFFPFSRLYLPWANLTRGAFGGSSLDEIVALLSHCIHLVECHIYSPLPDAQNHPILPIRHETLQILQIDLGSTTTAQLVVNDILDLLTVNHLDDISLKLPTEHASPLDALLELIMRSACTLNTVEVIGPVICEDDVVNFLCASPVVYLRNG